ncbi:hypothetical protein A3F08_01130 [Candidatus Berkelbacteria bacterium RIFCSPHIGHO2_12_FULL_36_9]|uniref:Large ribosomal subunit protein bL21 n=1 Tax=Candidatus Berkelbacteria bacterium RIFCSPHIGHO2_12_FULL_36_9 TaxID=1797469 RepID=A0A1F5EE06_9BACT|nr:MAG: hypothetical protein A3F08_01130 [Candidatus Berkelbacteria bacterium RIFCSPHIGHO2_12_FULL_36_9]
MSIGIIKTGGKQYKIKEGDVLNIEKIGAKKDSKVDFEDLLTGKKINASVLQEEVKGEKIRIFKFRRKVRYRRTLGHRQKYSQIKIEKIV